MVVTARKFLKYIQLITRDWVFIIIHGTMAGLGVHDLLRRQ